MKIFAIPRKTAVAVVVVWTVLGALLGHDYPTAGLVVSLGSIGYYLLLVGRRRIGYLLNLDRTTERQRLLVATAACMLYVLIRAVLTGSVSYFLLLVVLAAARVHALMPWLLSFAAGAMLYVVAEELLPRAGSRRGTCGYLVGFLFMMVLDVALG